MGEYPGSKGEWMAGDAKYFPGIPQTSALREAVNAASEGYRERERREGEEIWNSINYSRLLLVF